MDSLVNYFLHTNRGNHCRTQEHGRLRCQHVPEWEKKRLNKADLEKRLTHWLNLYPGLPLSEYAALAEAEKYACVHVLYFVLLKSGRAHHDNKGNWYPGRS